jgi:multidrug efflux system outer membrane protein
LPAGAPSDLLASRPDIRQAEQQLVAANANIGAARAAFFPKISLTAGIGSASSELSGLFKNGAWGFTLAPQLLMPLWDNGRNQAGLDSAQASRDIAVAQYEKAIQSAFREVADALAGRDTLARQLQALYAQAEAESNRQRLVDLRLQNGASSQLDGLGRPAQPVCRPASGGARQAGLPAKPGDAVQKPWAVACTPTARPRPSAETARQAQKLINK